MNRRKVLRGLICAPLVITTPGLLMPVKALPVTPDYAIYISGAWLDGSNFKIGVEHGYSTMDIAAMDWFDAVARIDYVTYTDKEIDKIIAEQSTIFDPQCRADPEAGKRKLPWFELKGNRFVHNNGIKTFAELQERKFHYSLPLAIK